MVLVRRTLSKPSEGRDMLLRLPQKHKTMQKYIIAIKLWMRTIRGKLTLWFVGSVIVTFAIFVAITSFVFLQILNSQVDHHVQTVLAEVQTIWHRNSTEREKLIESVVVSQGMIVMVMAPDGEILFQTTSQNTSPPTQHEIQRHVIKLNAGDIKSPHFFTINNTRFGLLTTPISPNQGAIGVGFSLNVLEETTKQSIIAITGIALFFIITLGILGQFLAKKALTPTVTIIKTAQEITSSHDLQARIPHPGTSDELGTLVDILNSMLARLEKSFTTQQQFFADTAHTLKTPITVVRTQLEGLLTNNTSSRVQITSTIHTIDQVDHTIKDLLYLAKISSIEPSKFVAFNLSELLKEVCEIARSLASEKNITVVFSLEESLIIFGDKRLLLRSVLNVVENAVTYTPPNGTITISAIKVDEHIQLTIKDTGIGIPPHQLDKIYDRFFRGQNARDLYKGTGLGLSITKAGIEVHHGTIVLHSKENEGTTVVITLPL
ncbi:hypothetical protein COX05_00875 [candidate division WWE3 bacterium CG22_combo_CG10-13_8_21_14_all_39_12]|uniref:histidine kinase n=1 Tax=candidate division WWE3 bacterium CG22_combo_CG10-13_8_21_14_all_39_12 TaxID=1975094 RepID=A0A2H0BGN6_UNCKA|nr:MAG: hypothetical protein COX05_00875 [candidate division WWE3 bacterium CG22_combo_CG10-13_8_21_14_all_39_12]